MPPQVVDRAGDEKPQASLTVANGSDRRFVTASETNDGVRIDEGRVKALTGGDPVTAPLKVFVVHASPNASQPDESGRE